MKQCSACSTSNEAGTCPRDTDMDGHTQTQRTMTCPVTQTATDKALPSTAPIYRTHIKHKHGQPGDFSEQIFGEAKVCSPKVQGCEHAYKMELQVLFFTFFFLANAMILLGTVLIIVVVRADPKLYSPMYFLLCNLSFMDICYTSVTSPRMLMGLLSQRKTIAFEDRIVQLFFLNFVGATEMLVPAVMVYNYYTAICEPTQSS
ncbi:hypothetical protein QYF61_005784 [Mycteria americana]|uniref:G-protein coupled receptors family 1 profile domain-containing protein n=1 Tax=Mycteria americana TaxID=33587 RepID=A0AAN7MLP8_MYCAM|nr:hypothetical protein QYF61_005784 [Mycteria americana]